MSAVSETSTTCHILADKLEAGFLLAFVDFTSDVDSSGFERSSFHDLDNISFIFQQVCIQWRRFKLADDDVTNTSVTPASDDLTDDVIALAADDDSSVPTARKSSHHGH